MRGEYITTKAFPMGVCTVDSRILVPGRGLGKIPIDKFHLYMRDFFSALLVVWFVVVVVVVVMVCFCCFVVGGMLLFYCW